MNICDPWSILKVVYNWKLIIQRIQWFLGQDFMALKNVRIYCEAKVTFANDLALRYPIT